MKNLVQGYELSEADRKIRRMILNVLSNAHVIVSAPSQGARASERIKVDEEMTEKIFLEVKSVGEGGDWERGKIMLTTEDPLYTGKICDENEKKARIFDKIHFCLSSEQRYGKSRGFAEYVWGLMKEYDKERTP